MSYFKRILLFPLGSYEYHGTELPAETDAIIATEVAKSMASYLKATFDGSITVLPTLNYGLSLEHAGRPTTAYVLHNTFYSFAMEIVSTVSEPKDLVVLVNGHGGNTSTLAALEGEFNCTYYDKKAFCTSIYPGPVKDICVQLFGENDVHAGSVEASLISYYLQTPSREYNVKLSRRVRGSLRFFRSLEIAPEGVIKRDPTVIADSAKGEIVHRTIVENYSKSVCELIVSLSSILQEE